MWSRSYGRGFGSRTWCGFVYVAFLVDVNLDVGDALVRQNSSETWPDRQPSDRPRFDRLSEEGRPFGNPLSSILRSFLPVLTDPGVIRENNPQVAFWNALANGYTLVELGADEVRYEPRGFAVDRALERPEPRALGRFCVRAGSFRVETA